MSRVITFSRVFPSYHPRKGEPTYFVEKVLKGLPHTGMREPYGLEVDLGMMIEADIKHHTIIAGHRFKVGDWFSPLVWSGKPYNSKQIVIAPDIQVKKTWDFKIIVGKKQMHILVNGEQVPADTLGIISMNDGLSFVDFMHWFKYPGTPFDGQITSWSDSIEY